MLCSSLLPGACYLGLLSGEMSGWCSKGQLASTAGAHEAHQHKHLASHPHQARLIQAKSAGLSECVLGKAGGQSEFIRAAVYHYKAITLRENLINRTCNAVTRADRRKEPEVLNCCIWISPGTAGLSINRPTD
ncbi:hypothetical protein SRHO_G00106820 [Serrasalmus rhombeus]